MELSLSKCRNFEDLCEVKCQDVLKMMHNPKTRRDERLYLMDTNNPLHRKIYELWLQYNKNGFYTIEFSHEFDQPYAVFKSLLDYQRHPLHVCIFESKHLLSDATYTIKQRARVEGFMKFAMAKYVYEKLKSNSNYDVFISPYKGDKTEQIISLSFKNGEPMTRPPKTCDCKPHSETGKVCEHISHLYERGNIVSATSHSADVFKRDFKNKLPHFEKELFDDNVIVLFSLSNKQWKADDYCKMWIDLDEAIDEYNQSIGRTKIKVDLDEAIDEYNRAKREIQNIKFVEQGVALTFGALFVACCATTIFPFVWNNHAN